MIGFESLSLKIEPENMKISFKLLILFCLLLFLIYLNYLFADIMEARNFVSVREMVDDGNWIFTTMNGEARYQKPPLPTWLSAIMAEIFGTQTLWALRFPAALSSVVLIGFLYKFIKKETGSKRQSALVSLIFATGFLVLFIGKRAEWDIYCYNFALIGTYFFWLTFKTDKKNFLYFSLSGIFLGLSILSKGPTGLYVISVPFFFAYWITYGFPKIKWGGWLWLGFLMLLIGLSWYLYIYAFDKENLMRIIEIESNARTNHEVKPVTRYLSFPVQMGVWAVFAVISLAYPFVKKKTHHPDSYKFFFWWTIICLVLLSLVPSKKERYLFPLMIPLAATTGLYLYTLIKSKSGLKWENIVARISFGLIGAVGLLSPVLIFGIFKSTVGFYSIVLSIVLFVIGLLLIFQIFGNLNYKTAIQLNIAFTAFALILGTPVIDGVFNSNPDYHSIMTQKSMIKNSGLKLYGYNTNMPEIWFKYGEVIPEIFPDDPKTCPAENEFYLLAMRNLSLEETEDRLAEIGIKVELIGEFDDNEQKPGTKNNVNRKKLYLFKAVKN